MMPGATHVASRLSRDAGLAEGRSHRAPRPPDDSFPLDRKRQRLSDRRPAAAVAAGDGRASTSARCCRPTTRRSPTSSGAFADGAEDRRGAHHLAGRHRSALSRRRSAGQSAGRRRVGGAHGAAAQVLVDHEIELPAGVVRVAPLEDSVEGVIAFPPSQWDGRPVEGLQAALREGPRRRDHRGARQGGGRSGDASGPAMPAARSARSALGFNPLLAVPERDAMDSVLRLRRRRRAAVARRQHRAWRRGRRPGGPAGVRPLEFFHRPDGHGRQHDLGHGTEQLQ